MKIKVDNTFFRFEVNGAYERTFFNTGLYYFHLEQDDGTDLVDDEDSCVCVVKVTQTNR